MRIPALLSIILILAAGISSWLIWSLSIPLKDKIEDTISIFACLGALISAAYVVHSYLQTNLAFIESQRPRLLIFVQNLHPVKSAQDTTIIPTTAIRYKNLTNNQFNDLTIQIQLEAGSRSIDFSDIFRKKMILIGLDERQRSISIFEEANRRGLDIQATTATGTEVRMKVSYSYTFMGKENIVNAQEYRWNATRQEWEIY